MVGTMKGGLMKKLGLKGKTKPGDMIKRMNDIKSGKASIVKATKMKKTKPQGRGIVKALGQKGTTGNFKKIEKAKGKGAAIGALMNKLNKKRGKPTRYGGKQR